MEFRKGYTAWTDDLQFFSSADRDTAAKMIEAMTHWSKVGGDVIDNIDDEVSLLESRYCFMNVAGYYKDGEPIMDSHYGPTPWDAILAAKEASNG